MKKFHHYVSLTALCIALYGNTAQSSGAGVADQSCWGSFTKCFTRANMERGLTNLTTTFIPLAETLIALTPLDDETKKKVNDNLERVRKASQIVGSVLEEQADGSVKVTLQNGLSYVITAAWQEAINQNLGIFTEESKMLLSLLNQDATQNKATIMLGIVPLIILQDDPKTPNIISYDSTTGDLKLVDVRGANIGQTVNIFGAISDTAAKQRISGFFTEYHDAALRRTAAEKENGGTRIPTSFLESNSAIVTEYNRLVNQNPASILINVIRGQTSVDTALNALNPTITAQPTAPSSNSNPVEGTAGPGQSTI